MAGEEVAVLTIQLGEGVKLDDEHKDDYWGFSLFEAYKMAVKFYKENEGKRTFEVDYESKVHLAALTKQVSNGPFNQQGEVPEIGMLDVFGNDRRKVWTSFGDMSSNDARRNFIDKLQQFVPVFAPFMIAHQKKKEEEDLKRQQELAAELQRKKEEEERERLRLQVIQEEEERIRKQQEEEEQQRQEQEQQKKIAANFHIKPAPEEKMIGQQAEIPEQKQIPELKELPEGNKTTEDKHILEENRIAEEKMQQEVIVNEKQDSGFVPDYISRMQNSEDKQIPEDMQCPGSEGKQLLSDAQLVGKKVPDNVATWQEIMAALNSQTQAQFQQFASQQPPALSINMQQIMAALNAQTQAQFQQYAAQQHPGNPEQQTKLIALLQEQHYQQYIKLYLEGIQQQQQQQQTTDEAAPTAGADAPQPTATQTQPPVHPPRLPELQHEAGSEVSGEDEDNASEVDFQNASSAEQKS